MESPSNHLGEDDTEVQPRGSGLEEAWVTHQNYGSECCKIAAQVKLKGLIFRITHCKINIVHPNGDARRPRWEGVGRSSTTWINIVSALLQRHNLDVVIGLCGYPIHKVSAIQYSCC